MNPLRIIPFDLGRPDWNMAVDAVLCDRSEGLALRLYGWHPHAVSLGYFQTLDPVDAESFKSEGFMLVRRSTGGGAIVHAHELTYSLSGSTDEAPFRGDVRESYRVVHDVLIALLRDLGVDAHYAETHGSPTALKRSEQPFFCFARSTALDVVTPRGKIVGSAKRCRDRRAVQHGSLIVSSHPRGIGQIGISDEIGRPPSIDDLATAFIRGLASTLSLDPVISALTPEEKIFAADIAPSFRMTD